MWSTIFFIAIAMRPFTFTWQYSLPTDPTYNAGVVELPPNELKGIDKALDILAKMRQIIESNATRELDIIVFPEDVLNDGQSLTYVPDPELLIAPCDAPDYDPFLNEISCMARSRQLYVVINLVEKIYCAHNTTVVGRCNASGVNRYNTNVVFDRKGRVISRYRKTHLYGYEWYANMVLPQTELATFTTDFGVTFGTFICFDMLFWHPASTLVQEYGITDIIYPTYWFSELPFLVSVQLQEGWAFANDVNLLAADASKPSEQNGGSGIYAGRLGRLTAFITEAPTMRLLTAKVPKRAHRDNYQPPAPAADESETFVPLVNNERFTKFDLLRDYNVDIFDTQLLADDFTRINETVCYDGQEQFCCHFEIRRMQLTTTSNNNASVSYRYRLGAFSGARATFQRRDYADLKICAVIACTNDQLYSCGHIFPENVAVINKYYFSALKVSAEFAHATRRLIMPTSVDGVLMPVPVQMYEWHEVERDNSTLVSIDLKAPKADLLTFGIWANYFSQQNSVHNLDNGWQLVQPERPPKAETQKNFAVCSNFVNVKLLLSTFLLLLTFTKY